MNPRVSHSVKNIVSNKETFQLAELHCANPTKRQSIHSITLWSSIPSVALQRHTLYTSTYLLTGFFPHSINYHISVRDFFRDLKAFSFTIKTFTSCPSKPSGSIMETLFLSNQLTKGTISKIQDELAQTESTATLEHLQKAWQEDLGVEILDGLERKSQEYVLASICGSAFATKSSRWFQEISTESK